MFIAAMVKQIRQIIQLSLSLSLSFCQLDINLYKPAKKI
ncbi:MAG: hypothetical protein GQF41_0669 [Candidatus Rifleibacterium amylolyticum]|nr:MAG: hypothetical protein GQF41_0669 [Candidatus Rifleibacterium amylolyticum]